MKKVVKSLSVLDVIKGRREIVRFENKEIPAGILEQVVDAGYYAPTGNNLPSRELIVITKREGLDKLSETTPFMKWLKEATAAIIITGRPGESKYWLQDASIASSFIWLTATDLGLGMAFGAVYHSEDQEESERREQYVREMVGIPSNRRIVAVLGMGYPLETPQRKKHQPREKIVHIEKFSSDETKE